MLKLPLLVALILALTAPVVAGKDKNSSNENAIRDEVRKELDGDKQKGKGRPDDPGEHGRDNAAQKQRDNPGKGSKGDDSWEDAVRDKFEDDDDKDDKNKGKDKGKNKKK